MKLPDLPAQQLAQLLRQMGEDEAKTGQAWVQNVKGRTAQEAEAYAEGVRQGWLKLLDVLQENRKL